MMNKTVAAIGKMNFEGNIIPMAWFSHLTFENGKPNTVAIICLSEIVYWYRPVEIRDEETGKVTGYRKKFRADKWQCNYQAMADRFGFSKEQVRNALHFLEEKGCITLEFRHFTVDSGTPLSNVLFVEPVPLRIAEINAPTTAGDHIGTETDMGDMGTETEMGGDVDIEIDTISAQEPTHIGTETDTYTETPTETPKDHDHDAGAVETEGLSTCSLLSTSARRFLRAKFEERVAGPKGRDAPLQFETLAVAEKFDQAAARLNGSLNTAIEAALGQGTDTITRIVSYIAKYDPAQKGVDEHAADQGTSRASRRRNGGQAKRRSTLSDEQRAVAARFNPGP